MNLVAIPGLSDADAAVWEAWQELIAKHPMTFAEGIAYLGDLIEDMQPDLSPDGFVLLMQKLSNADRYARVLETTPAAGSC